MRFFESNKRSKGTFDSTDTLKGIAIIAVLLNHYLNLNVGGDSQGFANLLIGIFFMMSGYSIAYSLQKLFAQRPQKVTRNIFTFYSQRIIRIFPLFWVAYIVQSTVHNVDISLLTLLGVRAPGHFWFIPAILQCYLVAPLVYVLIHKNRVLTFVGLILGFVLLNYILLSDVAPPTLIYLCKYVHGHWRGLFFLYILLFALSLFITVFESCRDDIGTKEKTLYYLTLFASLVGCMIIVKYRSHVPVLYEISVSTIYPLLLLLVSSQYAISMGVRIPIISFIGAISYPLYLFHILFFREVVTLFPAQNYPVLGHLIVLVLLPLLVTSCVLINKVNNHATSYLRQRISG